MKELADYHSIKEKDNFFKSSKRFKNRSIDNIEEFEKFYTRWMTKNKEAKLGTYFFRGMTQARYRLYTSAQRMWMTNERKTSEVKVTYREFFKTLLDISRNHPVLSEVFKVYKLKGDEISFPALSLIQHYGGPSPLMDWSYELDIALYFAMEKVDEKVEYANLIGDYVSVYRINNTKTKVQSLSQLSQAAFPSFNDLIEQLKKGELSPARLFYMAGFEETGQIKSLTSIYNQNIITQKGLFIFNPSRTNPLEDYFPKNSSNNAQIRCYNIHKSLAGHIRKIIADRNVTKEFIYPDLNKVIEFVKEEIAKKIFK